MDKQEKSHHHHFHQTHKKCHICQIETETDCLLTEMAQYSTQTGNLIMVPKLACQLCREQIQSVRHYVQNNNLSFGKQSQIYFNNIQPYVPQNKIIHIQEDNTIYQRHIQHQIKRSKIYHEGSLPQNCLQLVYYCSFGISQGERHLKIMNTLKRIMTITPVSYSSLTDISILVHCLTCFMSQNNVVDVIKHIMDMILVRGSPFKQQTQNDYEMPFEPLWRQLLEHIHIGNIIIAISLLLRNQQNFQQNIKKLKQKKFIVSESEVQKLFGLQKTAKKAVSIQNSLQNCQNCHTNKFQYLKAIAQQKNMMSVLLKVLGKQQQSLNQYIKQIEQKHAKQKQQYINKIIRLKDKIQILQKNDHDHSLPDQTSHLYPNIQDKNDFINQIKKKRSKSITEDQLGLRIKYSVHDDKMIPQVQENSQVGSNRFVEINKNFQDNGNETQPSGQNHNNKEPPQKKDLISSSSFREQLHKLLMIVPEIDPTLLESQVNFQILFQKIEQGMLQMQQQLQNNRKKIRTLENQSKRLLNILTRKQQRFIPLIHEKDQIIQKYQHALWRMQNFLPIQDQHLGPRIQTIINKYKQDFLETLTVGTNVDPYDDLNDSFLQVSPSKQVNMSKSAIKAQQTPEKIQKIKKQTKSEKKKIKKKTKKNEAQQSKDCTIF